MVVSVKQVMSTIVAIFVLLCIATGYGFYHSLSSGPKAVDAQLAQLIQGSHESEIAKISMDPETEQFLLRVSRTSKVLASDSQGSVDVNGVVTAYFPCYIGGLNLNVYMKATESTWMQKLSPHWVLYKASLKPASILPNGDVSAAG